MVMIPMIQLCVLALLLALPPQLSALYRDQDDSTRPDVSITRIAFGSCSKTKLQQRLWKPILASEPNLFLWTGDAVYLERDGAENFPPAYSAQLAKPEYRRLIDSGTIIDGVYDDHDLGKNDAGATLEDKEQSKQAFLNFLGVPFDSPRRSRAGAYSSHTFGEGLNMVKIIMLDTRYNRADHMIPSVGGIRLPLTSLVACATRWLSTTFCLTEMHDGDILGEEQWSWLESRFANSKAAVHVLVSSVQVYSSNPLFEGWGHFPREKRRLTELLERYKPRGLIVVSGDVHHADLIGNPPIEMTSSGMTHTIAGVWYGRMFGRVIEYYSSHRRDPQSFFTGLNWGLITLDSQSRDGFVGEAAVMDEFGKARLKMKIAVDPGPALEFARRHQQWTIKDVLLTASHAGISALASSPIAIAITMAAVFLAAWLINWKTPSVKLSVACQ